MQRRTFLAGAFCGAAVAGCAAPDMAARFPAPGSVYRPVPDAGFDAWLAGFRPRAAAQGISQPTLESAFRDAGFLPDVIERDRNQAESSRSFEDYLAIVASDERVAKGQANFRRWQSTLAAVEARFGVESNVVCAVWGLESMYGERRGEVPVVSALATLAYEGRRGAFFESQLVAALKILQAGDVPAARMTGSWAGAMGHTQFIPTSYLAYAVDFDGDGRRDIWAADPSDALASTASYLARAGWRRGERWGMQVRLPAGYAGPEGRSSPRGMGDWQAAGLRAVDGTLPATGTAALLRPAGAGGPAFLVFGNFSAILRYNNSELYGLGIGHLSDRIIGRPAISGPFPPDANGLTRADRQEIQRRLASAGHDVGAADGVIGAKSRAAISAYQRTRGLAVSGEPSVQLLQSLRRG